jgi:hypothetical protein
MRRSTVALRACKGLAFMAGGTALLLVWAIAIFGQDTARSRKSAGAGSPFPRLPGAVSKAPEWLGSDAPFDVAKFFAAPPRDRNAAPLYLDAFFEFGSDVESCFPEGAERDRRRQAAQERSKRYSDVSQSLYNDPNSVPIATVDEVIKLYDAGFRKLAEAQRRERCVFETGVGLMALLPHVQEARTVTRIASLRVQRAVQRGDFDAAIRDVETVLRLTRDLQPRGPMICQLVVAAITQVVGVTMVPTILAAPGLQSEHCDRLLKVIVAHDAKSTDGYSESLRADYVMARLSLRDLVKNQRVLAKDMKLKPGDSVVKAVLSLGGPSPGPQGTPDDLDARVARTSAAELSRREREVGRHYRALLALDGVPYSARLEKIAATSAAQGDEPLAQVLKGLMHPDTVVALARAVSRATATLRATECLVALRRWQLSHRGLPPDLGTVVKGTVLKSLPIDPYDGKPMRLVVLDGQPVIYSVGRDGQDDGGRKDSKLDMQAGDLLYRLPPVEERRGIRPV